MFAPNSKLQRVADASVEPLGLADAKAWLRLETGDDDAVVSRLITAARMECEDIADRSFLTTAWRLTLDFMPFAAGPYNALIWPLATRSTGSAFGRVDRDDGSITLPRPPLVSLTSISYIDQSGATQSLDVSAGGGKVITSAGSPGRIFAAWNTFFPFTQPRPAAVDITYRAGYGDTPDTVPAPFVQAIATLTAFYYEHRSEHAEPPGSVTHLIQSVAGRSYA